jgi:hypothetical protein
MDPLRNIHTMEHHRAKAWYDYRQQYRCLKQHPVNEQTRENLLCGFIHVKYRANLLFQCSVYHHHTVGVQLHGCTQGLLKCWQVRLTIQPITPAWTEDQEGRGGLSSYGDRSIAQLL